MRICIVGGLGTLGADIVDAYHGKHQLFIIDALIYQSQITE